jgi:hypothetical protein
VKTTIELPDELLQAAKQHARENKTTLRALIADGLARVLAEPVPARRFRLRDQSVDGDGLHKDLRDTGWETVRALAYEGRGG